MLRPTAAYIDRPFGWANSTYEAIISGLRLNDVTSVGYAGLAENQTMQEKQVTTQYYLENSEQRLLVPPANYTNVTERDLSFYCCSTTTTVHVSPGVAVNYSSDYLARKFIRRPQLDRAIPQTITSQLSTQIHVIGNHLLNTNTLQCVFNDVFSQATYINDTTILCTVPLLDLQLGQVVNLTISLNGQEHSGDVSSGLLPLIGSLIPTALAVEPQFAYYGDQYIIIRVKA